MLKKVHFQVFMMDKWMDGIHLKNVINGYSQGAVTVQTS